ncbi:MAG: hypothetical protein V1871_02525 [Planctomycetota bacterium]
MKWWKVALIISAIWIVLTIGAGIIHTNVILKDKITQAQDEAISEKYGQFCAGGLMAIWILTYLLRKRQAKN